MRGQPSPPTVEKKKPNTVSAAIDDSLFSFIENWRWDHRKTKTEVVVEALNDWAILHGYSPDGDS